MADLVFSTPLLSPPSDVRINGEDESDEFPTKSTGQVTIQAVIKTAQEPTQHKVRVLLRYSKDNWETFAQTHTPWHYIRHEWGGPANQEDQAPKHGYEMVLNGLKQNTLYEYRLYAEEATPGAIRSDKYNGGSFWTNRPPTPPELNSPAENAQIAAAVGIFLDWKHSDPDPGDKQNRLRIRYRTAADTITPAGAWVEEERKKEDSNFTIPAGTLKANRYYEWQARTQDPQLSWSDWSLVRSFFVLGLSSPPSPLSPVGSAAAFVDAQVALAWRFRDPDPGDSQIKADVRYRAVGTSDWFVLAGDEDDPGANQFRLVPEGTFTANVLYEWQVRTYDSGSGGDVASDWSTSAQFWGIKTPGTVGYVQPILTDVQGALGCGTHRVFVYTQGGQQIVGEIKPLQHVVWTRKRDDIANAIIDTNGFDDDCGQLLGDLRSWIHELVIFRDGVRVFEGPITRITYTRTNVQIEAKDVMAYVYRRIMRQGYDDSFHLTSATGKPITQDEPGAIQFGLTTVVKRAARILINALAPHDPNVLPYLTVLSNPGDAQQTRVMPDYCKTAWEEIDDLASNAGLDYTTIGRRILLWDTHNPIGKLPEMRDGDFSDPVIVTEYGMNLSNYFGVTNGNGIWGAATPYNLADPFVYYGPIEQLASSYGETEDAADPGEMTADGLAKMRASMAAQAQRSISNRWPSPLVVRVPDNSSLNPEINLGVNQLVPGVWIPLRAESTPRVVAQWQKLDHVTVEEQGGKEQIKVVMSPAPNGGLDDPDAGVEEAEE